MTNDDIKRINELGKKFKSEGLTDDEMKERELLRKAYLEHVRAQVQAALDNTYIQNEDGTKTKLQKKVKH